MTWVLQLNDMRASNIENVQPRACAETRDALEALLQRERVQPYVTEGRWHHVFRAGGPLEWCNPPLHGDKAIIDVGTEDDWARHARERYRHQIGSLPTV